MIAEAGMEVVIFLKQNIVKSYFFKGIKF